jgi:hypothetical protein
MSESPALPTFSVPFDPVPVATRHDGWSAEKQRAFVDALAACGCVKAAADHVGMTAKSAYRLRNRPEAASFAAVWDRAQREGFARTRDNAVERAIYGERVPIYRHGRQVGTRVRYNDRLIFAVLNRDTARLRALASSTRSNGSSDNSGDIP